MYTINLNELCLNQNFTPEQVVSSDLVYPRGAVPNSRLLWVRVELTNGNKQFVTLPLMDFYRFIELPESSIGGWTDGNRGSDYSGLNSRYEINHSGGEDPIPDQLLVGAEGAEEVVATPVPEQAEDRKGTGI